ncbi:probable histone-lysine N-methyltransferase CG1716 [Adelges cooleyi]|uniref:probable histone-lysine N-methyltransferase CG1716 n=1 Tax=Adelges cooleyi TaxID=133065 RepID=UPI00218041B0|nr:probable histone-lysine N-methyltransferase CG1716 [Adelges cooleyi]
MNMDESYLENINLISTSSSRTTKQLEKLTNSLNLSTTVDIASISQNDLSFIDNNKTCLPNKKQRLKAYLTKTTNAIKYKATSSDLHDLSTNRADNLVSETQNYNKPVKVKSRWTHTSQMEITDDQDITVPPLSENSPQEKIVDSSVGTKNVACNNSVVTSMIVSSVKARTSRKSTFRKYIEIQEYGCSKNKKKHCTKRIEVKKKKGRPTKSVFNNNGTPSVSSNENSIDSPDSLINSQPDVVNDVLNSTKKRRGRSKKRNETVSDIIDETANILSGTNVGKERRKKGTSNRRTKNAFNISKETLENNEIISNAFEMGNLQVNSASYDSSSVESFKTETEKDSEKDVMMFSESINCNDNVVKDITAVDCNEPTFLHVNEKTIDKIMSSLEGLVVNSSELVSEDDYEGGTEIGYTTEPCVGNKQTEFDELKQINWNNSPSIIRSKSDDDLSSFPSRRQSLCENFKFSSCSNLNDKDFKINKSWKSLSYLEGGPNHVEKCERIDLDKKFRTELKRSRSFPNCMLLDTVIWRYLVYQQTYNDFDQKYDLLTDTEVELINELPFDGFDREIRSKSVPIGQNENHMERENIVYRSSDNLNSLSYLGNHAATLSFESSTDMNASKIVKSDLVECGGKIRRSKRLTTKIKRVDIIDDEELEHDDFKVNYLLLAKKIWQANENQLAEARKTDPELEKKLKTLNFKLVPNNLYKPERNKMSEYTAAEAQDLRKLKPKATNVDPNVLCECTYTKEDWLKGRPGCGEGCLNRLLNIECGSGCPLKSFCTNKQFQNKQFKHTQLVKTQNKGYGVCAFEDIPKGSIVDEYVGEVIDQHEMIRRMKLNVYKNNNYMVQLKHDEVIDATRKGNITRFINHSCEPNCIAEKWHVLGESRMGFFSSKDIKKGEEITFDYSFQIFGDAAQQKCYCGTPKCRGFISKKSRTSEQSSSEESDDDDDDEVVTTKPEECVEKKKKLELKRITIKDKKRLRDLDKQLMDISNLKNKSRTDLEKATLNLNKLMVHITDSMSRSHILKFIREHDLNCKRFFMNFNGLNIIHSWMTSNNDESLKLEIIETLSELPISNRNTIKKSKVLDTVAEWAKIPVHIKNSIENLVYPVEKSIEHGQEVDKLLPNEENISPLMLAARVLWKRWIILKMVFKIPKIDRPKEVIAKAVHSKPAVTVQIKPQINQYHFGKPLTTRPNPILNNEKRQNKFTSLRSMESIGKEDNKHYASSMEKFSKMITYQKQQDNCDKSNTLLEWKKKHREYVAQKADKRSTTSAEESKHLVRNSKRRSLSTFINSQQDIPTIGSDVTVGTMNWNDIAKITPADYQLNCDQSIKTAALAVKPKKSKNVKYFPIEEIVTKKPAWSIPPPTINELLHEPVLKTVLNIAPPHMPEIHQPSDTDIIEHNEDVQLNLSISPIHVMNPENILYDAQHPSITEQTEFLQQKTEENNKQVALVTKSEKLNTTMLLPSAYDILLKQADQNLTRLFDNGLHLVFKSSAINYIGRLPIQISPSSSFQITVPDNNSLANLLKRLKVGSNFYTAQPSNVVKIKKLKCTSKALPRKSKNVFRIKEKKTDLLLDNGDTGKINDPVFLNNRQLVATPQCSNVKKMYNKQTVQLKNSNKFACKILNGLLKKSNTSPSRFITNTNRDMHVYSHDVAKEVDLYHKLVPTVKNTLCANLKKKDEPNKPAVSVFKRNVCMKFQKSAVTFNNANNLPVLKINEKSGLSINNVGNNYNALKRKINCKPLLLGENKKRLMEQVALNNNTSIPNAAVNCDDNTMFKKPMLPASLEKTKRYVAAHTVNIVDNQVPCSSKQTGPSGISMSNTTDHLTRQKPLMKCLPFPKVDTIAAIAEKERNARNLATSLSLGYFPDSAAETQSSRELIDPIVNNYKSSLIAQNCKGRLIANDPIVRDYLNRARQDSLKNARKCKLPESMMSLPVEVLNLIPDSLKEMKYVIDFYHSMATVIVKVLDSYVKKSCKQGRIKNDDDFKYLAKKLNANILFKELQARRVEDLKISEGVKNKVEQYIKKYMLKFGKVYKRKTSSDFRPSQP